MPLSKSIERYPRPMRDLIHRFAYAEESLEHAIPPLPMKQAVTYRARFYACRKILAERKFDEGRNTDAEKLLSVGMRLTKLPDNMAQLTVYNQNGDWDTDFLAALESAAQKAPQQTVTSASPHLSAEQLAELQQTTARAQQEREQTQESIERVYAQYSPDDDNDNPYLSDEDEEDQ